MIRILCCIFLILLCIVLFALLAGVLLLSVRTGVEAVGVNGAISIEVKYGGIRIPIWPRGKEEQGEKTKEQPKKTKKPPKKQRKRKKYRYTLNKEELDVYELLDLMLTLLGQFSDELQFTRLHVRAVIGTDDAAKTAMLLGYAAAVSGMMVPFLENTFEMKDYRVTVDADFETNHTEWAFAVFFSVRPVKLGYVVLRHMKEFFRLYKRLLKKEAIENE